MRRNLLTLFIPLAVMTFGMLAAPGTVAAATITLDTPNPKSGGYFGNDVAAIGDVNGDGISDALVGAPREDAGALFQAGRAYVFSGATGNLLYALTSPNASATGVFGNRVAAAGYIDGDNVPDFMVAATDEAGTVLNQGRVYVFSGDDGDLIHTLDTPYPAGEFGSALAAAGDVNADGTDDLIVGAWFEDPLSAPGSEGAAYVFSGASGDTLYRLISPTPAPFSGFGISAASVDDVDGDGRNDIVVGAIQEDSGTGAGRVHIFSGADGSWVTTLNTPDASNGQFGISVAGVGDIDGDGHGDVLVGASLEDAGNTDTGRAYLFSPAADSLLLTLVSPQNQFSGEFGATVAGIGDINGDGIGDLAIGAPDETAGSSARGFVHCLDGTNGDSLLSFGPPNGEVNALFGSALDATPDDSTSGPTIVVGAYNTAAPYPAAGRAFIIGPLSTTVSGAANTTPTRLTLRQNYPNPFNPSTTIAFDMPAPGMTRVEIFDVQGRSMRTLIDREMGAGPHTVHWDGRDDDGHGLSSGVYFCRLTTPAGTETRKMNLVR